MPTLRELRKERVMTQTDLAEKSGLSWRTVYRIEKGEVTPVFKTINKLAHGLGVEPGIIQFKPGNTDVVTRSTDLVSYVSQEEFENFKQAFRDELLRKLALDVAEIDKKTAIAHISTIKTLCNINALIAHIVRVIDDIHDGDGYGDEIYREGAKLGEELFIEERRKAFPGLPEHVMNEICSHFK